MSQRQNEPRHTQILREFVQTLRYVLRWLPIAAVAGVLAGCASALLIVSLQVATATRENHKWIIGFLPLAGFAVGWIYQRIGRSVDAGNNLVLDEIHDPKSTIPIRMAPLILFATFISQLFGASIGREGTAIQTGASLADQLAKPFRLDSRARRVLLMAGISAGFGSVFGTPLAGAVFGVEVLALGAVSYEAIVPCFIAAYIGDLTTRGLGVHHDLFLVSAVPGMTLRGLLSAALAGILFGLVALAFARGTHRIGDFFKRQFVYPPLRPFAGGILVALSVLALHTTTYIGLGIPTIRAAFTGHQPPFQWLLKLLFTSVSLGAGFKGGEVTPLFFIGATLGNALSSVLPLPPSLLAGMGFVGVFAGASNTPLASTLMAMELFGSEAGAYAAIACVFSYLFSGHAGIYSSQLVERRKYPGGAPGSDIPTALAGKLTSSVTLSHEAWKGKDCPG